MITQGAEEVRHGRERRRHWWQMLSSMRWCEQCRSGLVNEFFLRFLSFNFKDTFKTGESLFYIFFKHVFITDGNIK